MAKKTTGKRPRFVSQGEASAQKFLSKSAAERKAVTDRRVQARREMRMEVSLKRIPCIDGGDE